MHAHDRAVDHLHVAGIFWVLRTGAPWRDMPERYGPYTTAYNRFNRWRKAGIWDRLMDAIVKAHDVEHAPVFLRLDAAPLPRQQRLDDAPLEVREIVAHDPGPNVWERKSLFEFRV